MFGEYLVRAVLVQEEVATVVAVHVRHRDIAEGEHVTSAIARHFERVAYKQKGRLHDMV